MLGSAGEPFSTMGASPPSSLLQMTSSSAASHPALGTNDLPAVPLRTTVGYQDSRFAYQIMGGLSIRAASLVEFRLGYRFRSSRGAPIDADHIEAGLRFQF